MRQKRLPIVLLGMLLAAAYFIAHTVYGTHGLVAKGRWTERSSELEREVAVLEAVRTRLRQDVLALRQEPPPPDTVEEAARSVLGMIRPGDLIVMRRPPAGR